MADPRSYEELVADAEADPRTLVRVARAGAVATVTLDDPAKYNVLSAPLPVQNSVPDFAHAFATTASAFGSTRFFPPVGAMRIGACIFTPNNSAEVSTLLTSVMTRIFGMPVFWPSFDMATNFSTIGRTLPGLQYMMSRMSSMASSFL